MKTIIRKTKPIIFQNNDFQTIQIKVFFPFKRDVENIAMMNLLPGMLHHQCSMYPTEREYSLQMQKLFILSCYCSSSAMIQDAYFSFNFMISNLYWSEISNSSTKYGCIHLWIDLHTCFIHILC